MNLIKRSENALFELDKLKEKYSDIKNFLTNLFLLNAQDQIDCGLLVDVVNKYSEWQKFAIKKLGEFDKVQKAMGNFSEEKIEKILRKSKNLPNPIQEMEIDRLERLHEQVKKIYYEAYIYYEEIRILWDIANKEMPISSNHKKIDIKEAPEHKIIFSGCIDMLYYRFVQSSGYEDAELNPLVEIAFEKSYILDNPNGPVVLMDYELEEMKKFANFNGLKFDVVEWTPENCCKILFDYGEPKTPFKELDDEINHL